MRKILAALLSMLLLVFITTPAQAVSGTWSTPVDVSTTPFGSGAFIVPEIAADGIGNVFTVWEQSDGTDQRVWISKSSDHGNSWSAPLSISPTNQDSTHPVIAIDDANTLFVAWSKDDATDTIQISRSSNAGATWASPVDLSTTGDFNTKPVIASYNTGIVTVAWRSWNSGASSSDILASSTTDSGATWSPEVAVSTQNVSPMWHDNPSLNYSPTGVALLSWVQEDCGYTLDCSPQISSKTGSSWSSPSILAGPGDITTPHVASGASNELIATWANSDNSTIRIQTRTSSDNGATWSTIQDVTTGAALGIFDAQIVSTATGIYTILFSFGEEVQSITSMNNGQTWLTATQVSEVGTQLLSTIESGVDTNGNIFAAWQIFNSGQSTNVLSANTSEDHGATWGSAEAFSNINYSASSPSLTVDSSGFLVASWNQNTNGISVGGNKIQSSNVFWATPNTPSPDNGGGSELARTGFDFTVYFSGIIALFLGIGFIQLRRKF